MDKPVDPGVLDVTRRSGGPVAGPSPRVLLAEDNPINAKVAAHSLRRLGYEVDVAGDGRQALDALAAGDYDVVLMDCEMPVLDGYAATREFRAAEPPGQHIPIVALTASTMAADRDRCLAAGMDDYLSKPVWDEHLAAVLRRLVDAPVEVEPDAESPLHWLDEGQRRDLVEAFLATMTPQLDELVEYLRAGAAADVMRLAHDLRPTSTIVGAYHLAELLGEVEEIARAHPADLAQAAESLAAERRRVVTELAAQAPAS